MSIGLNPPPHTLTTTTTIQQHIRKYNTLYSNTIYFYNAQDFKYKLLLSYQLLQSSGRCSGLYYNHNDEHLILYSYDSNNINYSNDYRSR